MNYIFMGVGMRQGGIPPNFGHIELSVNLSSLLLPMYDCETSKITV